ncbi:MAG: hypothetical protein WCJ35_20020 [Planctomycetota bacterium]
MRSLLESGHVAVGNAKDDQDVGHVVLAVPLSEATLAACRQRAVAAPRIPVLELLVFRLLHHS